MPSQAKSPRRPTRDAPPQDPELAEAYSQLVEDVWGTVCPLVGAITLSALVSSSFRRSAKQHRFLESVVVTMDGIDKASLVAALASVEPKDAAAGMGELLKQLLGVFESIAGPIIVKQVVPIAMRMEKLATSRKERS